MQNKSSLYTEISQEIVLRKRFTDGYIKLLKCQSFHNEEKEQLTFDEIAYLLKCASIFSFSDETFKHLSYKIAAIVSENYSGIYENLPEAIQYIMICSGQLPVINKITKEKTSNFDYFSIYQNSENPFNPAHFDDIILKQANNTLQFHGNVDKKIIFTDFQSDSFNDLISGRSVSISAPTSSGKTFLLIAFLAKKIVENDSLNVVYIVPSRALIAQVLTDIREEFKDLGIEDIWIGSTSKISLENQKIPRKIFVLTQERFHNLLFDSEFKETVNILIVDEAQKVSDPSRGILLEEVIEEAVKRFSNLQTVFISPFSKNPEKFSTIFQLSKIKAKKTTLSPVSQNLLKLNVSENKFSLLLSTKNLESENDIKLISGEIPSPELPSHQLANWELLWAAKKFGSESNIIYCNSPDVTVAQATIFCSSLSEISDNVKILEVIKFLHENIHPDYYLIDCLKKGVGYHHGKMPIQIRTLVEDLFKGKELRFLFCTSTLLEGVNLPAQNIFIMNPTQGKGNYLKKLSFWNLAGRAGRLLQDYYGNIYCINIEDWNGYKPDPDDVENEIESGLENALLEKDIAWIENLKKIYINFKNEEKPLEQAVTKFLIQSLKKGQNDFVIDLLKRNPYIDENSMNLLKSEINKIALVIEIPGEILQKNSMVNPLRQQLLYEYFKKFSDIGIPLHPTNRYFGLNLNKMLKQIDFIFLDSDSKYHTYISKLIEIWINDSSMSDMIKNKIYFSRIKGEMTQKIVNKEIELLFIDLNSKVRFRYQNFLKCYIDILLYYYNENHLDSKHVHEQLPLYIEFGTYQPNNLLLQSIGLSRTTAIAMNRLIDYSLVDEVECMKWMRKNQSFLKTNLSPVLYHELDKIL